MPLIEIAGKRFERRGDIPGYNSWKAMMRRCDNPKCKDYRNYGGRGIRVCKRWYRYENFLRDMGLSPGRGYSIERVRNDGPYSPENCIWGTRSQQQRNTRRSRTLTLDGSTACVVEWAKRIGIGRSGLKNRLDKYGFSLERALTQPPRVTRRPVAYRKKKGESSQFDLFVGIAEGR